MQHLDEGTIHAWLDGELPPDDAESAARHVAGCGECHALVVEARGLLAGASRIVSALDAGPAGAIPPAQKGWGTTTRRRQWYSFAFTPVRMSIAATILVAAGLTLTARHAADNNAMRGRLIDSQINVPTTAMSAPASADSLSKRAVDRTVSKLKGAAESPAPAERNGAATSSSKPVASAASPAIAGANVDMSSSKSTVLPKAQVNDAASFEAKTLHLDSRAVTSSPRQVAAAAGAPAAEPSPPAARLDTGRAKDEAAKVIGAADSLRREQASERRRALVAGNVNQLQEAVVTERDASGVTVVVLRDCYRLAVDSTSWRGILPSGFALTVGATAPAVKRPATFAAGAGGAARGGTAAGAAPRAAQQTSTNLPAASPAPGLNTVRALDSIGRVGSRAIGLWSAGQADTISVRLATADAHRVATVLLVANSPMARVISSDRTDSVRVARLSCSR